MCDCMYCRSKKFSVVDREECNGGIFILLLLFFFPAALIYCLCITRYAVHHCGNCGKVLGRTPISWLYIIIKHYQISFLILKKFFNLRACTMFVIVIKIKVVTLKIIIL